MVGTSAWQSDEQHEQSRQSSGWQNEDQEPGRSSSTSRQKQAVPAEPVVPTTDSFAAFEAEYSQSVLQSRSLDQLKDEVVRLNEALRQALSEKAAISSKFEKLTTICRSQRQELQDLKSHLHSRTSNSIPQQQQQQNSASRARPSQSFDQGPEAQSGTIWDLQEGLSTNSGSKQNAWAAFEDAPKQSTFTPGNHHLRASTDSLFSKPPSDRSMRQQDVRASVSGGESWKSVSPPPSLINGPKAAAFGSSLPSPNSSSSVPQKSDSPAGWAGF